MGFTNSIYWFKIKIFSKINEKWIMEIGYPPLDNISVYLNGEKIFTGGDKLKFNTRYFKTTTYAFYLPLKLNKTNTIYFNIQTASSLQFPIKIYPEKLFLESLLKRNLIEGVYVGILLVMIFYNFFIYLSVKDKTYLIYIMYVLSCLFFYLTISGLTFKFLFPENVYANNRALPFAVNSITFWGTLFGLFFLNIRKHNKLIYYFILFSSIVAFILLILSVYLEYSVEIQLSAALSLFAAIFLLAGGIFSLYKGYKPALFYVLGWLTLLTGGVILVMNKFGIIPENIFTENILQVGSVIEVIFLSFSLGERINNLQHEKNLAEMKILKNKILMTESFKRFVPEQFLKFLNKESIVDVKLGDAVERDVTIMFNDIRGFTNFSENMDVKDNFAFLNSYFNNINPVIHRHKGFIDKFIGDSVMAIFPYSSDNAVHSAIETQKKLLTFNEARIKTNRKAIYIGIGIHYGKTMLGTVGSHRRLSTTVIGDTVNLASRIEALTKIFKVKILISETVFNNLKNKDNLLIREVDIVKVRGKTKPVKIYEVFNADKKELLEKKLEYIREYNIALRLYRKGNFKDSTQCFLELFHRCKKDFVLKLYMARCKQLMENTTKQWDGITDLNNPIQNNILESSHNFR